MTDASNPRPFDLVERLLELLPTAGERVVVTDLEKTWTLFEVVGQAAAIAQQLEHASGGPVGVLVNRSVLSVAAVYAPLWAGRTLVALDVADSPERIEGILDRVGASTVLDATGLASDVLAGRIVERPVAPLLDRSRWPEPHLVDADAAALVSFTSGSTGRPKGIRKTFAHARVNDGLYEATPGFTALERTAAFMPLHFKGGFAPIIHGVARGRFTALVDLVKWTPDEIAARLRELEIERLSITPSALRVLLRSTADFDRLTSLRSAWCVGEPLMWSDVELVRERIHPNVRVVTGYGASEALGFRMLFAAEPDAVIGEGRVPIGLPVVQDGVRVVPIEGDPLGRGELVYRGNLTEGYFDEADLDKERFVTDTDGIRMWRSGDLVSTDSDGLFHLRGRIDDMVKINGKLVEPAESETFLRSLPGVRDASVVVRRRPSGRVQLVAHLVTDHSLSAGAVFEALRNALPAHIRPSVLVRHDELPRTDRGKADRQALARSDYPRWTDAQRSPERDPLVAAVVGVARELLDLDDIGADETLRDLGMDSLATLEFIALLHERGLGDIDPSVMVTLDSSQEVAEELRMRKRRRRKWVPTVIHPEGSRPPLFFVVGGGDLGLRIRSLAAALGPQQPIVVLEQHGLSAGYLTDRTVEAAARRFLRVVEMQVPSGEVLLAGHSYGGLVAHALAGRLERAGRRVRLVLLDTAPGSSREMLYPDALRDGEVPSLVRSLKRVKWWAVRRLRQWKGLTRPTASRERHDAFFSRSIDASIRYRPIVLCAPTTYLCADGGDPTAWAGHPSCAAVRVPGDHLTMLDPPHVIEVAAALNAALGTS